MENWQLTLVILASVLVGALVPLLVMATIAIHRAGREIAELGERFRRTLTKVEAISDRVEVLSRGLDRNMRMTGAFSTIVESIGAVIAAFLKTRFTPDEAAPPPAPAAAPTMSTDGP